MKEKNLFWVPLDNAAKIFPAIRSKEHTPVIRLTAVLNERITISSLLRAVERTEKRFPYFKVNLRRGFFWYYLEQVDNSFSVLHDIDSPCKAFDIKGVNKSNDFLKPPALNPHKLSWLFDLT